MHSLFNRWRTPRGQAEPLYTALVAEARRPAWYIEGAVPDTLGEAGVQFGEKDVPAVAELAHRLVRDSALRRAVLAGQRRRLAAFAPATVEATLRRHLASLIE